MSSSRISLAQIRVATPCAQSWQEMDGDDRARFCTHCDRHVHNLSGMARDQAERLICESAGRLCIAYFPKADGSPQTLEYRPRSRQRRFGWIFATVLGSLGALAAAVLQHASADQPAPPIAGMLIGTPPPLKGQMIVGDMGPPATQPAGLPDMTVEAPL